MSAFDSFCSAPAAARHLLSLIMALALTDRRRRKAHPRHCLIPEAPQYTVLWEKYRTAQLVSNRGINAE